MPNMGWVYTGDWEKPSKIKRGGETARICVNIEVVLGSPVRGGDRGGMKGSPAIPTVEQQGHEGSTLDKLQPTLQFV